MAEQDEIYNIILRTAGEEKVRVLRAEVDKEDAALRKLIASLGQAGSAHAHLDPQVAAAAGRVRQLEGNLRQAESETRRFGGSTRGSGQNLLQFARAADDAKQFSYGFAQGMQAIGNNLVEINPAFGLAAVAIGLVATHWRELAALFGDDSTFQQGYDSIEGLTERVKELRAQLEQDPRGGILAALRGADQAFRRMTALEKATKDLATAQEQTVDQKANKELVEQAVTEAGNIDVVAEQLGRADVEREGATGFLGPDDLKKYNDLLRQRAQLEAQFARDPDKPGARKAFAEEEAELKDNIQGLEEQARNAATEKARTQVAQAAVSDLGREQLAARVRELDPDLAAKLTGAKPTEAAFDETFDESIEKRKKDAAKRRATNARDMEEYLATDQAESDRRLAERKRRAVEQAGYEIEGREYVRKYDREQGEALFQADADRKATEKADLERRTKQTGILYPGLDEVIGEQLKAVARAGGSIPDAQEAIFQSIGEQVGQDVALGLVNKGGVEAQQTLVADALQGKPTRASEVIDSAAFASAIQAGVGGQQDTPRKHLLEAQKTNQLLTRLLNRPPERQGVILGR